MKIIINLNKYCDEKAAQDILNEIRNKMEADFPEIISFEVKE